MNKDELADVYSGIEVIKSEPTEQAAAGETSTAIERGVA